MNKEKYQESLNDIIRNCEGFPCKNDSFYNMQELVDNSYIEYIGLQQENTNLKQALNEIREYIKDKQKIQYKFALSHIECDDILQIIDKVLGDDEINE